MIFWKATFLFFFFVLPSSPLLLCPQSRCSSRASRPRPGCPPHALIFFCRSLCLCLHAPLRWQRGLAEWIGALIRRAPLCWFHCPRWQRRAPSLVWLGLVCSSAESQTWNLPVVCHDSRGLPSPPSPTLFLWVIFSSCCQKSFFLFLFFQARWADFSCKQVTVLIFPLTTVYSRPRDGAKHVWPWKTVCATLVREMFAFPCFVCVVLYIEWESRWALRQSPVSKRRCPFYPFTSVHIYLISQLHCPWTWSPFFVFF